MSITRALPARTAIALPGALGTGTLVALLAGAEVAGVTRVAIAASAVAAAAALADYLYSVRAWRLSSPVLRRQLPAAFAIGVKRPVPIAIDAQGARQWHCALYDHADATLVTEGMPVTLDVQGGKSVDVTYTVMPTVRGQVVFAPAAVRVRTRWGFWDLLERLGTTERRRVKPAFAQVARYAWLAGTRRLQEIGIKTYELRGQGTVFKQLSVLGTGDALHAVDSRATLRLRQPDRRDGPGQAGDA